MHLFEILVRFFHDHVDQQHPVHASCRGSIGKPGHAVAQDGVEIGKDDQASLGTSSAEVGREREHFDQAGTASDSAFAGALDHRAVAQRVAKGHAQLDHVRASVNGGECDLARQIQARV